MASRDIIVLGGSAGALEVLIKVVSELPRRLAAALFVVIHTSPDSSGALPEILARASLLPVSRAQDGGAIEQGRIYVAPPDYHLLVGQGEMTISHGPRENGFRPAIDPLFYSAARSYGPRVIGALLSGALDDGTYGLKIIKEHGGVAVVQHPNDALISAMPMSAIQHVEVDQIVTAAEMPLALIKFCRQAVPNEEVSGMARQEPAVKSPRLRSEGAHVGGLNGPPSIYTCPECGGTLWEKTDGELLRFRCHTGHAYSSETLMAEQDEKLEKALWSAVRVLQERAVLRRDLADRTAKQGMKTIAAGYEQSAVDSERQADILRGLLTRAQSATKQTTAKRKARSKSKVLKRRGA